MFHFFSKAGGAPKIVGGYVPTAGLVPLQLCFIHVMDFPAVVVTAPGEVFLSPCVALRGAGLFAVAGGFVVTGKELFAAEKA